MNLNIIRIRLKFEFESNFTAAHYCKPQAHPSAPHVSPASALCDRIALPPPASVDRVPYRPPLHVLRVARASPPPLLLRVAHPRWPPLRLSFSLFASIGRPPHASFAFPSTVRHRPKRTTPPPAPRCGLAVCLPRCRKPPPRTSDLEPLSPPSSSIGEHNCRTSSSSFPLRLTVSLPSRSRRSAPRSLPGTARRRQPGTSPSKAAFHHPVDEPSLR
jgi:hypothetical protein